MSCYLLSTRIVCTVHSGDTPIYDLCSSDMLEFYKRVILADFMASPDIHGSFFDECDSFIEGCCGNHPFCENNTGVGGGACEQMLWLYHRTRGCARAAVV